MIKLAGLFPEHLNLNGDFGNLQVVSQQLTWRDMPNEFHSVTSSTDFDKAPDLILIGHGSEAAWADIETRFERLIPELRRCLTNGAVILAVSTGFEMAIKHGLVDNLNCESTGQRVSKFEVTKDVTGDVLGYVNTDTDLPHLYREGSFLGTTLHGPVLAKNPGLLEDILARVAASAHQSLLAIRDAKKADLLAGLVADVWKLEEELASE